MSDNYFMGLDGFVWFTGVVEDRNDPDALGRVRVRCLGFHTEDLNDNNNDEELVYELEKYNVRQPKRKTRQLVKDKSLPNLNYMKLK